MCIEIEYDYGGYQGDKCKSIMMKCPLNVNISSYG